MHGARVHDSIVRGLPRAEWPAPPLLHGAAPRSGQRRVLWVGVVDDDELSMARSAPDLIQCRTVASATSSLSATSCTV